MTPPDQRNGIIALSFFFILSSSFENISVSSFWFFVKTLPAEQCDITVQSINRGRQRGKNTQLLQIWLLLRVWLLLHNTRWSFKILDHPLTYTYVLHHRGTCGLSKRTVKNFASNGGCATFFGPFSTCSYFVSQFWHHVVVCGWLKCHNVRGRCLRRRIIRQPCL